jgi:alkylation response protein AidB-like acyl-CoA dehydrogenase
MDFTLSEDQTQLIDDVEQFAGKALRDNIDEHDAKGTFNREQWAKCADFGMMGLVLPENYGGLEVDIQTATLAFEALGYGARDAGLVHAVLAHVIGGIHIQNFGTEEQREKYLPQICSGNWIGAEAITEAGAGSDFLSLTTHAEKEDGGYLINGTKMFISNGPICDFCITFAVSNPARKSMGRLSCFIIDRDTDGFEVGKPLEKMGLRTLQNSEMIFMDCHVPTAARLGKEGLGSTMFGFIMEYERILLFASIVGTMRHVVETAVSYAKVRKQFGKPISEQQAVSHKLADMQVDLELSRLILYKAAWKKNSGKTALREAAMCKLTISEAMQRVCLNAMQIHGAYGYMHEYDVEREVRDALSATIYSGTSEIQRNIIARLTI